MAGTPAPTTQSNADALKALSDKLDTALTSPTSKLNYIGFPSGDNTVTVNKAVADAANAAPDHIARDATTGLPVPRYYSGEEWSPATMNMPPQDISQLQTQLVKAGLLGSGFIDGKWDDPSAQALQGVISMANHTGTDWPTALQSIQDSGPMIIDKQTGVARRRLPGESATGVARAPLSVTLTNPDDLASVANTVAEKRLGRTLSASELQNFVSNFQSTERGSQSDAYNANASGGTSTNAPSPTTAANTYAEQIDPVAAQARNMLPLVDGVVNLFKGNGLSTAQPGG